MNKCRFNPYFLYAPLFALQTYCAYQGRTFGLVALYGVAFIASIGLGIYFLHGQKSKS